MTLWQAVILGIVEGVTEFLPISSTGHLMLTSHLFELEETSFQSSFNIAIQLGAILAVVVLYWRALLVDWEVQKRVALAFVPTAILGFVLYKVIKQYLLTSIPVVLWSLGLGGVVIVLFERWHGEKNGAQGGIKNISYLQSVCIGLCQSLAMVPGVSRAAATVLGGLALGVQRRTMVEFSFLLAVPTMAAATALDLLKTSAAFSSDQWLALLVGFVTSMVVAGVVIEGLLRFVKTYTLASFGFYRLLAALLFGVLLYRPG